MVAGRESSPRLSLLKTVTIGKACGFSRVIAVRSSGMITILSALLSMLSFRFRSRASLELELVALRHQLIVLRRQRPRRLWLYSADRLLWVCLYRVWPRVLDGLVIAKPATVMKWHRKGFRIYWRWRSRRPGRPKTSAEIRALIRRMSRANPLWGAPRIHGENLCLAGYTTFTALLHYKFLRPTGPIRSSDEGSVVGLE
jgi:putative transposase